VLSAIEQARFGKKIHEVKAPENPIFIIGHWRTGTTFLQRLLCLHDDVFSPTLLEVTIPDIFLTAGRQYRKVMASAINETRPMDNVTVYCDAPEEDEYALFRLSGFSPFEKALFPQNSNFFLLNDVFMPETTTELNTWKSAVMYFYKKILLHSGNRRLLIKNPCHSMRIGVIKEMFPGAQFIHIRRDPLKVIPSSMKLWRTIGLQNCLNTRWRNPSVAETTEAYATMISRIEKDKNSLSEHQYSEISFEELQRDPARQIASLVTKLGLDFSAEYQEKLNRYLEENREYKKNTYHLTDREKTMLCTTLESAGYYSPSHPAGSSRNGYK
jgi:hypothetical protein